MNVLVSRDNGPYLLYELQVGRALRIGRATSADIIIESPKISGHHADIFVRKREKDGKLELCVTDTSTNGVGMVLDFRREPIEMKRGVPQRITQGARLVMPLRANAVGERTSIQNMTVFRWLLPKLPDIEPYRPVPVHGGDACKSSSTLRKDLPDAYDEDTGRGRWHYYEMLGQGGLGVVYRAFDGTGGLGTVAVKMSKWSQRSHGSCKAREAWQVYILHREAQWSHWLLHRQGDSRHDAVSSSLFVRYLEDHTGFPTYDSPEEFAAGRAKYEAYDMNWSCSTFDPSLPKVPYVVMELAPGQQLSRTRPEEVLSQQERCLIEMQAVRALEYLSRFDLIHRDFRTSNIHVAGRGANSRIKVLDLGLMIAAEASTEVNGNNAVKAFWNKPTRDYDWVPPEARIKPFPNYGLPSSSFDIYSLAVLVLRLHGGKEWTKQALQLPIGQKHWRLKLAEKNLPLGLVDLLATMLGSAVEKRPNPRTVAVSLAEANGATAVTQKAAPTTSSAAKSTGAVVRSRSPREACSEVSKVRKTGVDTSREISCKRTDEESRGPRGVGESKVSDVAAPTAVETDAAGLASSEH